MVGEEGSWVVGSDHRRSLRLEKRLDRAEDSMEAQENCRVGVVSAPRIVGCRRCDIFFANAQFVESFVNDG